MDVSKKVKSGNTSGQARENSWEHTHHSGHQKDPEDKNHLIADEETAPTVRYIFQLALQGMGNNKIGKNPLRTENPKAGIL